MFNTPQQPTGRPRMWVGPQRRDGKYPVTYAFSNGVRLNKLLTEEKLASETARGSYEILRSAR